MKKRILIVSSFLPYPLNSGGHIGVFEMVNHFKNSYNISLAYLSYQKEDKKNQNILQEKWPEVKIHSFRRSNIERIKNSLLYRLQNFYFTVIKKRWFPHSAWFHSPVASNAFMITEQLCDADFVNFIRSLIKKESYDLIQVEFYGNISLPIFLKVDIPIIFIHHELRFVKFSREIDALFPDDPYLSALMEQIKAYEIKMLRLYDKVVLLSENDKKIISAYLEEDKLYSSPLSIRDLKKTDTPYKFNNILTFLGGGSHFPNRDGLIWFLETCFPAIEKAHKEIKLNIIGSWDKKTIEKYSSEKVIFCGFVENLENVLKNSIMIVPIRIGSGIRMKIIEASNMGVPVITTTIGVEGIDFRNKEECLIADTSDDFILAVKELVENDKMQRQVIDNAKKRIEELYSFDKAIQKRQILYNNILGKNE